MKVRALKYYYLDRKEYPAGTEFEMDDRLENEVNILCTLGTLEKLEGPKRPAAVLETRQIVAEPDPPQPTDEPEQPKRTYRRRDLRAEK